MNVSLEPELLAKLGRHDQTSTPGGNNDLDDDLAAAVRRTAVTRRLFYAAVLIVALYGTATGAVAAFDLPWWISIGGIFALELGGVTFLSHADVRRRLGEHATVPRLLGAAIAGAAATFNITTHTDRLLGGFFALMSVLGFASWWLDVETKRRDRLRACGQSPVPAPTYQLWAHWIRHPLITARARSLAKVHPQLGLYGSLEAAVSIRRREQRDAALAHALRQRIRGSVGTTMARIAVLTYDLDDVAQRLHAAADYDGLTALLASELTADHLLQGRDDQAAEAARAWLNRNHPRPQPTPPTAANGSPDPAAGDLGSPATHPQSPAKATTDAADGLHPYPGGRVRITILGEAAIYDTHGRTVPGVRAKSRELLVFLATHRAGIAQNDILNAVWPDVPAQRASQRLSTCLSNLRSSIRTVVETAQPQQQRSSATCPDPIVNSGGSYHLNPAIVCVDWWQLLDRQGTSPTASTAEDINAAAAKIADSNPYPWLRTSLDTVLRTSAASRVGAPEGSPCGRGPARAGGNRQGELPRFDG
jgi:hypothetical protein